jgi:hypothetical protein
VSCEATIARVNEIVRTLCPGDAGALVKKAMSTSAVVFPSDRIIPFQAVGVPEGDDVVVAEFNVDPAPELNPSPREASRSAPVDAQASATAAFRSSRVGAGTTSSSAKSRRPFPRACSSRVDAHRAPAVASLSEGPAPIDRSAPRSAPSPRRNA